MQHKTYIPPLNFSPVVSTDVSLYRSGYPMPLNYSFIKDRLNLKTIIYVGDKEDLTDEYSEFLKAEGIEFYHVFMDSCRDKNINSQINTVLEIILDIDNYPILIHSNKGKHRVGIIVGIIRKVLQGWSTAGIYQEYSIFSGGLKGDADLEFITMFETHMSVRKDKIPKYVTDSLNI
ncbi:hypothetical protein TPHA_0C03180 [Tetrapisispora phaffii CBS 4417]|uniref:Tyrosine-protein phosphatase-like protein OCA2 n=1 Tax=Tetrapisispora phaffii (strain ATCC 24235 / CBS 4417 / NBRC 1672 / NRRL Y-8282 / UCD 70-5) TaxID=1071381 RepID=G8BRU5_TETPH|nr:hypothetical protein TPHA_0C03180 [Tetrapisispora phaffii CBS 4417]CCE62471.1 hypothetical protein TPHA_0C03180 [Tetrapisispora phaffii CBS 4417]